LALDFSTLAMKGVEIPALDRADLLLALGGMLARNVSSPTEDFHSTSAPTSIFSGLDA